MTAQTAASTALSQVVAANIRAEAARRGWTQAEMARRLGMTRPVINERYRERTPWTLDEVAAVAELFGLEAGELLARPKGFEPLTFWLGADHTITGWPLSEPAGREHRFFCDGCGLDWNGRLSPNCDVEWSLGEHRWVNHGGATITERAA